jgi:hypothetical protein
MIGAENLSFFTIVARNYLAYAYTLGDSVLKYHPGSKFYVFLMDDEEGCYFSEIEARGFSVITPENLSIDDYKNFVFKYDVTEASTAIKPFVFDYLLNLEKLKVIYLDPDILCYRELKEVDSILNDFSIILTPHCNSPILDEERFPDDYLFLTRGTYNLGFIALRNNLNTQKFISWWKQKLYLYCINLVEYGMFVDQKWMDLVPAYFDNVYILRSLSHNFAYWNLHERSLDFKENKFFVRESGEELAFFHFSGLPISNLNKIFKYDPKNSLDSRKDLVKIFQEYVSLLKNNEYEKYSQIAYKYNFYKNSKKISQIERSIFYKLSICQGDFISKIGDPFSVDSDSFWSLAQKAGVAGRSGSLLDSNTSAPIEETSDKYGAIFDFIQFSLSILIRILKPELFMKVSKYMIHQLLPINMEFIIKK